MAGDIAITVEDNIATLRVRNPERRNAISATMWQSIAAFAQSAPSRRDIRVVIIRGDGDLAFSAGADIIGFNEARSGTANAKGYDDLVEDTCRAIEAMPQPAIAMIKGACMGAGASLAASCDLRVASQNAFFAVPAGRLGLGYDPRGIKRMLRVFGPLTAQILYTAQRIPAPRFHDVGGVHAIAEDNDVEALATSLARTIADNAPLTLKAVKASIRALNANDPALLAEAERLSAQADASNDYAEGRAAFAEKRTPRFTGS
ncbi:enoyl-CoA hydratase-related protein [Pseudorhodoplanes sinuspersici]|uniref:Enoyl-CoA hydratase n=1 Tax=Pseudorhodoplanes sinuspersici TaxID=1235591 RepID=A0A1W6ZYL1_9HYPH|nr:enoyl-CoA hydratase-related protein [Pseudorhodoplanes sinuspersici]ARQ02472.1 enoyl-CoA hydratase [Pseudorhodoplanes sinuspersici]RKE74311.1 enoyl-CoA hydratase/carnithine racemase [Pseudorhodoplanes sinuspersici]